MVRAKTAVVIFCILTANLFGVNIPLRAGVIFSAKNEVKSMVKTDAFSLDSLRKKDISFRKLITLEEEVVLFSTDLFNNFFYTDREHIFRRINLETGENRLYSVKENISFVECRGWWRMFLFNQEEGKMLILNEPISDISVYTFSDTEFFPLIAAPCADDGNHIWFFDSRSFSIVKYFLFEQSARLQLFTNDCSLSGDLIFLAEFKKTIFLLDKEGNLCLWDNFGNFIRSEKAMCEKVFFEDNFYTYFDSSRGCIVKKTYDGKIEETVKFTEKNNSKERFFYTGDKWFMLKGKVIWKQED